MERSELEVRYDILRGDLYRAEKRLAYYESGEAFASLEKKHEKEVRSLNYALSLSRRSHKKLSEVNEQNKEEIDRLRKKIVEKDEEASRLIEKYEKDLETYEKPIREMEKKISEMEGKIKKLSAQLNRDYTNSSLPSSKDEDHRKIANSRKRSGRLPGAQKGHLPAKRKTLIPDEVITLIPREVIDDPSLYEKYKEKKKVRQLIDIGLTVHCIQYEAHAYRNRITGEVICSCFPENVVNEVNYGEGVKALSCLLTSYCNVSIRKTRELFSSLSEGKLSPSIGFLSSLPFQLKRKTEDERKDIVCRLLSSPSLHSSHFRKDQREEGKYLCHCR